MIKRIFFISIVLILASYNLKAQTNLFTAGDNGTFEASGAESGIVNFNADNNKAVSITRSSDYAYGGSSFSLKVVHRPNTTQGYYTYVKLPITASTHFGTSLWIYIPQKKEEPNSVNPNYGSSVYLKILTVTSQGGQYYCSGTNENTVPVNTWTNLNVSGLDNINLALVRVGTGDDLTYFIDNVQALAHTSIDPNPTYGSNSIALNPIGGLPFSHEYTYTWSDNSLVTNGTRNGLTQGQIYSVTIAQGSATNCPTEVFQFIVGRPQTPSATDVTLCQNQSTALVASGATQSYHAYSWYDISGNRISQGATLALGPFTVPGLYKYYVQIDIVGTIRGQSSLRKEVIVQVNPLPDPQLKISPDVLYVGRAVNIAALNHQSGNQYNYKFYYTKSSGTTSEQINGSTGQASYTFHDFDGYKRVGNHQIEITVTNTGCTKTFTFNVEVKNFQPLCETIIPARAGQFKLDKFSGQFVFRPDGGCEQDISFGCIQGKVDAPVLNNVVSASATTFSDRWDYDDTLYPYEFDKTSPYDNGRRGKWRPEATYAFNTGGITFDKNYNSGMFTLRHFNWQYPKSSKRMGWIEANHVDKYSPNGEAIEEHNALNISSAAKFGYGGSLPYLIAQNATYSSVLFESFENLITRTNTTSVFEDGLAFNGGTRVTTTSHAGAAALSMNAGANVGVRSFSSNQITAKGLLVKVWAKNASAGALQVVNGATATPFKLIVRTGEWVLYEALLAPAAGTINLSIKNQSTGTLFIDDLRIQPQDAEMTAYVYDVKTLRLLTVFDDQHFGLYYQYNAEGKLIRKIIETERGLKTLQETQYNIPVN